MVQVLKHLPSKFKALSSNYGTMKKKERERNEGRKEERKKLRKESKTIWGREWWCTSVILATFKAG
jgi:hypothetical protein